MARSKKPRKKYKPKNIRVPLLVGVDSVYRPLERIVDQLERDGTINTSSRGTPMFQDINGLWFASAPAISGIIDFCEMYNRRHDKSLPILAMSELRIALDYSMPVFQRTLNAIKADVVVIRKELSLADPDDLLDILQQTRIKEQFDLIAA